MKHLQIFICMAAVSAFLWLAMASYQRIHADDNHGYTKSEVKAQSKLIKRQLKSIARAEQNQGLLVSLLEPDGSPDEVVLYHKGSAVK